MRSAVATRWRAVTRGHCASGGAWGSSVVSSWFRRKRTRATGSTVRGRYCVASNVGAACCSEPGFASSSPGTGMVPV